MIRHERPGTGGWLRLSPGTEVSEGENGLTFLDSSQGRILVANRIGTLVWSSAASGLTLEEAATVIATRFGISHDQARQDIRHFVQRMECLGLAVQEPKP